MRKKPWTFENTESPVGEGDFFLELKCYLLLSRDLEGYIRLLSDVNEKIYPFYNDFEEWTETILGKNIYIEPYTEDESIPKADKVRDIRYELVKELSMQETLLRFVSERPSLLEVDSKRYSYLTLQLEQFKNDEGTLDMDIMRKLAYPSSPDDTPQNIPSIIEGYQMLLEDAKGHTTSATHLLNRVSKLYKRCKKSDNDQDNGSCIKKPHLDLSLVAPLMAPPSFPPLRPLSPDPRPPSPLPDPSAPTEEDL